MKRAISTDSAPAAIGTYSQAVAAGGFVFLSGQIPLDPDTMELVDDDITAQVRRVFEAVAEAAGGGLEDLAKLTVYLTNLAHFPVVNTVMAELFEAPYPARAAVEVSALPKGAQVEVEAIMLAPGGDH